MQGPRRVLVTALGAAASVVFAVTGGVAVTSPAQGSTEAPPSNASSQIRVVAAEPGDLVAAASERVTALPTREQAASIVMGHIPGTDPTLLAEYMRTTGIGGFILMGANIPADEAALREITASLAVDASLPPLIGIDEEGGDVTRLPWDAFASARTLKDAAPEATVDAFAARAALLQRVGVSVNFGIVADVTEDRSSFIYRRALGTTPDAGAQRVAAAVTGVVPSARR